jgi:hypothetical protein
MVQFDPMHTVDSDFESCFFLRFSLLWQKVFCLSLSGLRLCPRVMQFTQAFHLMFSIEQLTGSQAHRFPQVIQGLLDFNRLLLDKVVLDVS